MNYLYIIYKKLNIVVLLFLFSLSYVQSDEVGVSENLNFFSMIGHGMLKQTVPITGQSLLPATLQKNNIAMLYKGKPCQSISLSTNVEKIVTLLICDSGETLICPGNNDCIENDAELAKPISKEKFRRKSNLTGNSYQIEFYNDRLIYRIQEKNCLIKYPHGCLIYGFGWHDEYIYEFYKS